MPIVRRLVSLVCCYVVLAWCGLSIAVASQTTLTLAFETDPLALDPRFGVDEYSEHVYQLVCNGLVQKDQHAAIIPDLAERWETPDEKTYLFYLRKGVKFHDGTEFTAEDVKYTFDSLRDPALKSPKSGPFGVLANVDIQDAHTVKFTLKKPFAPFLAELVHPILPKHIVETLAAKRFTTTLIGTGPFKLTAWQSGEQLVFERYPEYFEGAAKLERIVARIIPDETDRVRELQQGAVTFIQNSLSAQMFSLLTEEDNGLTVIAEPSNVIYYLGLNLQHPILQNMKVRQAMAYAIDRQYMIDTLLKGQASLATSILSPSNWAYEPGVKIYTPDITKAKALLDEAGYPDPDGDGPEPRFKLIYKTSVNALRLQIGKVLQDQLKQVGIEIAEIQAFEWAKFYEDLKNGAFELFALRWIGITEPDILHSIFHSQMIPPIGRNRGHYANTKLDELTEKAHQVHNVDERKRLYSDVQKILAEDVPYIFLWYPHNIVVMSQKLHGFVLYPDGDLAALQNVWFDE